MKRFILRILLFTALVVFLLVAIARLFPYNADGYLREQAVKEAMIARPGRAPSVVLLGGSNVAFGYDSPRLSRKLGMPVINMGLHAGLGLKFIVEACAPYLRAGDILVLSPEYDHFFTDMAYGEQPLADVFYLSPSRYAPLLDARQFASVANHTGGHLLSKMEYAASQLVFPHYKSVYRLSAFNSYGDATSHWETDDKRYAGMPDAVYGLRKPNRRYIRTLGKELEAIEARGVRVVLYPPAFAASAARAYERDIRYVDSTLAVPGYPFACPPAHTVMPDNCFYDTPFHLRRVGAERHTEHLARLLEDLATGDAGNALPARDKAEE